MLNIRLITITLLVYIAISDFTVPRCNKSTVLRKLSKSHVPEAVNRISYFVYAQNGTEATPSTVVELCHDDKFLYINATMVDVDIVSTLSGCNANLFTEDVFELFVATTTSYPYQYYEIQLSPKGDLFFADIRNPLLTCSNLETTYQQCQKLQYGAKITKDGWQGWLKLNLNILGRGNTPKQLMANMFRIDKNRGQTTKYECWKSTMSNPACFHKPAVFQKLVLE